MNKTLNSSNDSKKTFGSKKKGRVHKNPGPKANKEKKYRGQGKIS